MDRHTNDLYDRCTALRQRSARLRAYIAALHNKHLRIKEQMQRASVANDAAISDTPAPDAHAEAMEALRQIRSIIDPFPLEWQVAIVKALTARTLIKAHEQTRSAPAVISA